MIWRSNIPGTDYKKLAELVESLCEVIESRRVMPESTDVLMPAKLMEGVHAKLVELDFISPGFYDTRYRLGHDSRQ